MPPAEIPAFGYIKDRFKKTCDYCGCVFKVITHGKKGHEDLRNYNCPECGKNYQCNTVKTPYVYLISHRTDKRDIRYNN